MNRRIALVTTNLAPGGAETQVFRLATALKLRGWEVSVISLLHPVAFADALAAAGVEAVSLGMRPGLPALRVPGRLAAALRRLRPAILHGHMFHGNLAARLARLFFPVPVVISTIHSAAESSRATGRIGARDRLYRLTDPLADLTTAVSRAAAERHVACGAVRRSKLRVIPNGVDTHAYYPDPAARARLRRELGLGDAFVWLAAGRLMWKKDYPTLLRACAARPGTRLLIAGDGPDEAELRRLAAELAVDARFLGRRDDIPGLMSAADGLVLSSVVEGLPMVLLEAAACGLPAVSTDAGGACEVVVEGDTGFLAPVSDPAALASAMARLEGLAPAGRERMSQAARARAVQLFDIEAVAARWEAVYRELLERPRPWM